MSRTRRTTTWKPVGMGRKPPLAVAQILRWADDFQDRHGHWPTRDSGAVVGGLGLTWLAIDNALRKGTRGLNPGGSLAMLLHDERGHRHRFLLEHLTVRRILSWADAHRRRTGEWPTKDSGPVADAPGETWSGVDAALYLGNRGQRGGTTLAEVLARRRGRHSQAYRPRLTEAVILTWAEAYHVLYGAWPTTDDGPVGNTGETWLRIDAALRNGGRGLAGGSSLFLLLKAAGKVGGCRTPRPRGEAG